MGLTLALFQPDIAQNAGTMFRTCACLGVEAALIEPAGFPSSDRHFRRAGMDYLDRLALMRFACFEAFEDWRRTAGRRLVLLTTKAELRLDRCNFSADDVIMVGRESAGAPDFVHVAADVRVRVPILPQMRSLNVAAAAAMALHEALRQTGGFSP